MVDAPVKRKKTDGRPLTITDEQIEETLYKCLGNVSSAAKMLGLSRQWLKQRIDRSNKLSSVLNESRDTIIDIAELKLIKAVESGEPWAISLILKTLGKVRGYSEKVDVNQTGNIVIRFDEQDKGLL